jgi:hypothetical protein
VKISFRVNGSRLGDSARPAPRASVAVGASVLEPAPTTETIDSTELPGSAARPGRLRLRANRGNLLR